VVAATLAGGARALVFREKDLGVAERRGLGTEIAVMARRSGARFMVASGAGLAADLGADGVHLAASDPWPAATAQLLIGRSCHGEADLRRAAAEGADYATLSPIFATSSKPGYGPALGLTELGRAVGAGAGLPVYALGGVDAASAAACLEAGAAGVAVMGAVMGAADPAAATAALLAALGAGPGR
jgi:thiamine-phosphate pyrophosphorylase